MGTGVLTIDTAALAANWRALDALSDGETAAVIKANGYGLGIGVAGPALADAGARTFFVAQTEEGVALRRVLGPGPRIAVFSGHMAGDGDAIRDTDLIPMLNSPAQWQRHRDSLPDRRYGVQLDSGMNRLGMEAPEWAAVRGDLAPWLVMSHLACADEPNHPMNARQLEAFARMTAGLAAPRSLAATGGILLGPAYHFDMTRPGIGLYGGLPFAEASPVVRIDLPVIQIREVAPGETVGYGNSWTAARPSRIATVSAGYADGLIRAMSNRVTLWAGGTPCPLVGRVSMDLLTIDVTDLAAPPDALTLIGPHQTVDQVAEAAGTIGYEILTSLGARYERRPCG